MTDEVKNMPGTAIQGVQKRTPRAIFQARLPLLGRGLEQRRQGFFQVGFLLFNV